VRKILDTTLVEIGALLRQWAGGEKGFCRVGSIRQPATGLRRCWSRGRRSRDARAFMRRQVSVGSGIRLAHVMGIQDPHSLDAVYPYW